ncbi:MAG: pentapeptide repeat-containing protein [Cytophagales bacterium]|nr:pentapeptide repeat-containing protein [Cytophagales bacterium]
MAIVLTTVEGEPLVTIKDPTLNISDALQRLVYDGFNLSRLSLKMETIKRKNLQGILIPGAHFYKCHFSQVSFRDGNLQGVTLENCVLDRVDLERCQIDGLKLIKTKTTDVQPPL